MREPPGVAAVESAPWTQGSSAQGHGACDARWLRGRTVRAGVCVTPPLARGQVTGSAGGRGRAAEQTLTSFRAEFWGLTASTGTTEMKVLCTLGSC